jgi:hypothetical protein
MRSKRSDAWERRFDAQGGRNKQRMRSGAWAGLKRRGMKRMEKCLAQDGSREQDIWCIINF